ncbi:MAG: aminotransferase class IV [Actinomycetota bacterium]|nr:aminotransferase class IV [Actinomycetota bacterium]
MGATQLASIDGRIGPTCEAVLPLPDDGLYRGDGVFEVARLYGGQPFAMDEHWDRLERSAAAIDLWVDRAALEDELPPLLKAHGTGDAQLRVMVTRGGRRILLIEPLAPRAESVKVATVEYRPTVILDRVKSLSYAANMHATRIAKGQGADEAIFVTPEGTVLEPPTSTVFWASADGALKTPSLDNPILDSITRNRVVRELEVEEGTYDVSDLKNAAEAFLASTTREVQPISSIDGRELAWPGPLTAAAAEAFESCVERELGAPAKGRAL